MALTPETSAALKDALDAVISECGDHPEYAHLVEALQAAEAAIPQSEGHAPDHAAHDAAPADDAAPAGHPADDAGSADDMFAAAEAKHKDASKKKRAAAGGHDNPFADKADA